MNGPPPDPQPPPGGLRHYLQLVAVGVLLGLLLYLSYLALPLLG